MIKVTVQSDSYSWTFGFDIKLNTKQELNLVGAIKNRFNRWIISHCIQQAIREVKHDH